MQVHDGHDDKRIRPFSEKDAERVRLREAATHVKFDQGVKPGADTDAIHSVLNRSQKPPAEVRLLCFVMRRRFDHLGFRSGVEADGLHVNAA
jgi:hypothetical protein